MISIIIPTYNEEEIIAATIAEIKNRDKENCISEIIVSDGQSTDRTVEIASNAGATVITSEKKGRAAQMNFGTSIAKGEILYFLHADSIPPENFTNYILNAIEEKYVCGCFRLVFDYDHWFLRANCWFTRFNVNVVRFGDQSLFVTKNIFKKSGGFNEDLLLMEDQEIIHRVKKTGKFTVMNTAVCTSARKYLDNGIYRLQFIFYQIWLFYYLGYSQKYLLKLHKKMIRKSKL
ncbi:TIGR04283 family arsenosugar biosynthesis glycosyltransferase [Flavobacteriaceae bacterium F89]|uniref:TIGR04283 family arsenosugar biosynthesis glycosyltransferase n=1 Tax=Cerina litoralis TaxID=2874477 RepID=A0AAE3JR86_9FLAO|nr:TIGR04283 family arsenosugar biosynthesis glycosyltransferase [Cerina litoralis]MCG2462674.1 TIGR04283 family arsenosugar biosynthesis glycosyltransferase [Cerina litoralis]